MFYPIVATDLRFPNHTSRNTSDPSSDFLISKSMCLKARVSFPSGPVTVTTLDLMSTVTKQAILFNYI